MTDEATFRTLMSGDSDVATVVGTKIYKAPAAQDTAAPYITFFKVVAVPQNELAGRPDSDQVLFQVDCYAAGVSTVYDLANKVRAAVELSAYVLAERDMYDDETKLHRVSLDVSWFSTA